MGTPSLTIGTAFTATFKWDKEQTLQVQNNEYTYFSPNSEAIFEITINGFDTAKSLNIATFNPDLNGYFSSLALYSLHGINPNVEYILTDSFGWNAFLSGISGSIDNGFSVDGFIGSEFYTDILEGFIGFENWEAYYGAIFTIDSVTANAVPEPTTILLFGVGISVIFGKRKIAKSLY